MSIIHQVSRSPGSITLSWSQPDQPNGVILDYELQYYEKVSNAEEVALQFLPQWLQQTPPTFLTYMFQNQAEWNSSLTRSQTNTAVIRALKPGTIYVFQVRARTVAGFGRFSGKMYFQTMTEGKTHNHIYWPNEFAHMFEFLRLPKELQSRVSCVCGLVPKSQFPPGVIMLLWLTCGANSLSGSFIKHSS